MTIIFNSTGLRMFSYPWDGSDSCKSFARIGLLNTKLSQRTATLLSESNRPEVGSCMYNLTLINRCYPINGEVKMKLEPTFQNEKCTVSWHADSTLEHYSSIAVYHCTREKKTKATEKAAINKVKAIKSEKKRLGKEKKEGIENAKSDQETSEVTSVPMMDADIDESRDGSGLNNAQCEDVTDGKIMKTESERKDETEAVTVDDSWRISLRVCPNAEGPKAGKLKTGGWRK